jgi:hypothetical protein
MLMMVSWNVDNYLIYIDFVRVINISTDKSSFLM